MNPISTTLPRTTPLSRGAATDRIDLRPVTNKPENASSPGQTTKKAPDNFAPSNPKITEEIRSMSPAVHETVSEQLSEAHKKIAELELKLQAATSGAHPSTANSTAPTAQGKLKKMAGAIKNAFNNAPWEAIGKGGLYAAAGVAGFALAANPIGAIGLAVSCIGMVMGSPLLPMLVGAAAVYQMHQLIGKKPDEASDTDDTEAENQTCHTCHTETAAQENQAGHTGTAAAGHHGTVPFSQSLGPHPA
ncbi:hypothetical protein [Actimicrobium sp. CCI2.3]|uniref:hypothetical protein n=1 Tax=Actimicrobium sp. CCI2.3 TaxID=3048616 RepID=UPI002AB42279|nr:hypothetical protein [Actimicrobium sp. CCI2.3]MDY7572891.1 hypothetical protein [Actimicrobium sp. CCI2.3]MEB0020736.1 hypothetical protein [Actimicrobium sp. CCI2.3]